MPLLGPVLDAPVDVTDLMRAGTSVDPDAVGIVSADEQMTWRELEAASDALAQGYAGLGLRPGDRIASLMPNRVMLVVHYLACFRAGFVATPLNYRYATPELDHALEVSDAQAIVVHVERRADVEATKLAGSLSVGIITFADPKGETWNTRVTLEGLVATEVHDAHRLPRPGLDAPAAIFFTSGSTGPAKGVTHSIGTLGWMTATAGAGFELTPDDVFLPASSISHIGSFMWTLASFSIGARVVLARTFDAGEVLPLLRDHEPTILAMIPAALTALVRDHGCSRDDFASLRLCRSGADKVSLELEKEFTELVGFLIDEGYGMTEVGLATLNPPSGRIERGSIGMPVAGIEITLRDDDGAEVATGEVGKVWIKTNAHTVGYWRNPEATAEIMRDGWLDSGDLARADEDGYLWFFGRKKQIIVHDGSNISPFEVEGAIAEHPAVALVGVIGIHDEVHGETVRAYVTVADGVDTPTAQELIDFARERVGYKAPEEVVFLDEMPLNPTGKLDRVGLKRLAESHVNPHEAL
jgi:long-chain acyl-CoA synthetase